MADIKVADLPVQNTPLLTDFAITDKAAGTATEKTTWQKIKDLFGITLPWTETQGGTNQTTYTQGDILYASAANSLSKLAKGTKNQQLRTNAAATLPEWQADRKFIALRVLDATSNQAVENVIGGDFEMPFGGVVNNVFAYDDTAGVTGLATIDINKNAVTILSTKITIDSTEKTSRTAATPPVISVSTFNKGDIFTIDVDGIQTTPAKGLTIMLDVSLTDY